MDKKQNLKKPIFEIEPELYETRRGFLTMPFTLLKNKRAIKISQLEELEREIVKHSVHNMLGDHVRGRRNMELQPGKFPKVEEIQKKSGGHLAKIELAEN